MAFPTRNCTPMSLRSTRPGTKRNSRWKAGQFRELKRDAPYFQAAFRVRLANRLQDLGFGVERKRDDFEIAGIPTDVLRRFSRRTALIEKVAEEKGITDPDRKAELGAETRERKESALSWESLRKEWNARLSDKERKVLAAVHRRERAFARPERGEGLAVDHALEHSFVREAVVPERKLVTEALKRGIGAVTVEGVTQEMRDRPLIRSDVAGRKMATTKEMLALESKLIDFARQGRGRCRPLGDPERPCSRDWFNDGQKAAVRHVLGSRDRVMIIRGVAGTGKTTLEQEIGEALAEAGKPVVALAQSVKASREVLREEAGFAKADTVARFLKDEKMQEAARNGVILVDEASQLGTRDMLPVFDVAEAVECPGGAGGRPPPAPQRHGRRAAQAPGGKGGAESRGGHGNPSAAGRLQESGAGAERGQDRGRHSRSLTSSAGSRRCPMRTATSNWPPPIFPPPLKRRRTESRSRRWSCRRRTPKRPGSRRRFAMASRRKASSGEERIVTAWVPAHLTDAQKADATQYEPGDLLQFHQNAPGFTERIAPDRGRRGQTADRACEAVRGLPADAARPGRGRPRACHGRRQDQGRQASPQQRLTPDRPGIHQAGRHRRRSRLGHRPGFRPFDPRLLHYQPCQPGRYGG